MAPNPSPSRPFLLLTLLALFTHQTTALSVSKKAAIGIGVSIGVLLFFCIASILYFKLSPARRAERKARRGRDALRHTGEHVTDAEAIEFHERERQQNFNIWDYDHDRFMKSKKKKGGEQTNAKGPVETVA